MSTARGRTPSLPWPILAAGAIVGLVLLLQVVGALQPYLRAIAIVLWTFLGIGLLFRAGYLPGVSRVPRLHTALTTLTFPPGVRVSTERVDPEKVEEEARDRLAKFVQEYGQEEMENCLSGVVRVAKQQQRLGHRALGAVDGALVLLHGPPGTGKSTVARIVADLLYATGATTKRTVVKLPWPIGVETAHFIGRWRDIILQSLDGVLLIEEADRLAENDAFTGRRLEPQLVELLDQVAREHPGRLVIVATAGAPLTLERNDVLRIPFLHLADDALLRIIRSHASHAELPLDEGVEDQAIQNLHAERYRLGDLFDNAEAAQRLVSRARTRVQIRVGESITTNDLEEE